MEKIIDKGWDYILYKTNGQLMLSVVCGSVGLYEVDYFLNEDDLREYESQGEKFIDDLALKINNEPNKYLKDKSMAIPQKDTIKKAYAAFNERNIDKALSTMQPDIQWSKAWEGGYISGHDEIKKYWTRQWTEINPNVEPTGFNERQNGSLEVEVRQNVKDLQGKILFDGMVKHVYTFEDGLIKTMDIELV